MSDSRIIMIETDGLSKLPDDIIYAILKRLPLRDFAHLSTVSRTWKQLCASIHSISELNWCTMFQTPENREAWESGQEHLCLRYKDSFVRGVNQLIKINKSRKQLYLRLSFCLGMDSASDIDMWVRFAVGRGARALYLHLSCSRCPYEYEEIVPYILRPGILSSEGNSSNGCKLKVLSLNTCILGQGLFEKLGSLCRLELHNVTVGESDVESILACCLNLTNLRFFRCILPEKLCIYGSALRLECLDLKLCPNIQELVIFASNLSILEYFGDAIDFSLMEVPKLRQLYLRPFMGSDQGSIFKQLLENFLSVKILEVHAATTWVNCIPRSVCLNNTTKLSLFSPNVMDLDILKMSLILRAFPSLKFLHISAKICRGDVDKPPVQHVHKNLTKVVIDGFERDQIEFVKYILQCAVNLKYLAMDPRLSVGGGSFYLTYIGSERWNEEDPRKISSELKDLLKSAVLFLRLEDALGWFRYGYSASLQRFEAKTVHRLL